MGMSFESSIQYPMDILREKVDRIVLVLVGQPRATSLETWRRYVPEVLKETLYPTPENDYIYGDVEMNANNWEKGCLKEHRPIIDIVLVLSEYDAPDRYLTGEDPRLAGLDSTPYMTQGNKQGTEWLHETYNSLKFPVNKTKWETEQHEHWNWADSVNFVYFNEHSIMEECQERHGIRLDRTGWQNQYLHFNSAVEQLPEIFDNCTENSVVIRQRYDLLIPSDYTFWTYAREIFCTQWSGIHEQTHVKHHGGFPLTPLVALHDARIIKGHLNSSDESHIFDGTGAKLFGKPFREWLLSDSRRLMGGGSDIIANWSIPEMIIPKFCLDHGFTFNSSGKQAPGLFSLIPTPIADQWRYYWYDDWTPELVEELRKIAT